MDANIKTLIQQTFISPNLNQSTILAQWNHVEQNTDVHKILIEIAMNTKESIEIRMYSLYALKRVVEDTNHLPEDILHALFIILYDNPEQVLRKAVTVLLPVVLKFKVDPTLFIDEICKGIESHVWNSEVVITGCNIVDDLMELERNDLIKKPLNIITRLIINYDKFSEIALIKLLDTYGNCIFKDYSLVSESLSEIFPCVCKITIYCNSHKVIKNCFTILMNIYDKDKDGLYRTYPNLIKEIIIGGNSKDYDVNLSKCEALLHILEEENDEENCPSQWISQIETMISQ